MPGAGSSFAISRWTSSSPSACHRSTTMPVQAVLLVHAVPLDQPLVDAEHRGRLPTKAVTTRAGIEAGDLHRQQILARRRERRFPAHHGGVDLDRCATRPRIQPENAQDTVVLRMAGEARDASPFVRAGQGAAPGVSSRSATNPRLLPCVLSASAPMEMATSPGTDVAPRPNRRAEREVPDSPAVGVRYHGAFRPRRIPRIADRRGRQRLPGSRLGQPQELLLHKGHGCARHGEQRTDFQGDVVALAAAEVGGRQGLVNPPAPRQLPRRQSVQRLHQIAVGGRSLDLEDRRAILLFEHESRGGKRLAWQPRENPRGRRYGSDGPEQGRDRGGQGHGRRQQGQRGTRDQQTDRRREGTANRGQGRFHGRSTEAQARRSAFVARSRVGTVIVNARRLPGPGSGARQCNRSPSTLRASADVCGVRPTMSRPGSSQGLLPPMAARISFTRANGPHPCRRSPARERCGQSRTDGHRCPRATVPRIERAKPVCRFRPRWPRRTRRCRA